MSSLDLIEVWFASSSAPGPPPSSDLSLLSPEEIARAARFHFDRDRELFVLGKRLTRTLVGRALGLAPAALQFVAGERGKPELAGPAARSGLRFNLAHSGGYVYLALGHGRRVGVDVEHERESIECVELGRRFFCPAEIEKLEAGPPAETRRLFFKFWTLKEAYLKAEGSGLGISLTAMDASDVPDACLAPPVAPVEDEPRGIQVQRLDAPTGYAAALASDAGTWTTRLHAWRNHDFGASSA